MKKLFLFALATAMMSFAGCQMEEQNAPVNPNEGGSTFELVAEILQTKTTLDAQSYEVEWEEGDVVYMVTSGAETPWATSVGFTYADGKFSTDETIANGSYTFNGLYAVEGQAIFHKGESSTHKLEAIQTQDCTNPTAHIKLNDALVGTFDATIPMAEAAQMNMSHLYTLMQVDVKNETGAAIEVTKFEMTAADADLAGIFNIDSFDTPAISKYSGTSSTITVNLTNATVEDKASLPVYFVMAPLIDYSGDITLKVTDSEDNTYAKTVTISGISFVAGEYNTTPYTIKDADKTYENVTWDLTTTTYDSASEAQVVWSSEFVNLTLEKGTSTTNANNHLADGHTRIYKDQVITFDPLGKYQIESVVFDMDGTAYVEALTGSAWTNGEVSASGTMVTVTPAEGHAKVSATIGAAIRVKSIIVYYSLDEEYVLPTVESIEVSGQRTELMQNTEFTFGGTVTATDTYGETYDVTSAAKFSGYDMSTSGEQIVTVSYTEGENTVTTTYQLTVLSADEDIVDELDLTFTGRPANQTYDSWSGKQAPSGAIYAGNSAGDKSSIQLRSNNSNSGIVTTTSGGYAKKVEVTWQSETADGRTLNIYGKNTAYSAATDLYSNTNQGTLLGTIVKGTSTEFVIPGNYQYIGLRSASGAMYITEIQITWSSSPLALESIAVSGQKAEYYVGDSFVAPTITATYSDGSSSVVSEAEFSDYNMSQVGEQTVTVSYTLGDVTKEITYTINVKPLPTLISIEIDGIPTTKYTVGNEFDAPKVKATYSDGLVKTIAATFSGYNMRAKGTYVVTASYTEGNITKETTYEIVVAASSGVKNFVKVTSAPSDWSGTYLIVYETSNLAFDGSLTTLDAAKNTKSVTISNGEIEATDAMLAITFDIAKSGSNYTLKSKSGYYIGQTSNANGLKSNKTTTYANTITINTDKSVNFVSSNTYLRFNAGSNDMRFRYYKSSSYTSQKAIHLYKLTD